MTGRPYKSFDTTAFCSYETFHPSQYLTDNNWDILCAFKEQGAVEKLDSLGIPYSKSQLRLLEVGDLLSSDGGVYSTKMPIFSKSETDAIRRDSKAFADSIFPIIEPRVRQLVAEFDKAGYSKQTYSLIFSYLLDGYIWDDERLAPPTSCEDHGTWSGAYWAMYDSRDRVKTGTNSFGPVSQNWTDDLGYWLNSRKLIAFARAVMEAKGGRIDNPEVVESIAGWGLTDDKGNITIPVIHQNSGDDVDKLCNSISTEVSDAVKRHCAAMPQLSKVSSDKVREIIFYHEAMWDLLDILEAKQIVTMPAILKGEEVGKQHFGDITFIVIDDKEQ